MVVSRIQVRARTQLHLQYNNNCKQHSNSTVQQHNTPNFNSQFHNGDKAVLEELTHLTELSSGRPCLWNKSLTNISSIVWSPLGCYVRGSIKNNKRNWSICQCCTTVCIVGGLNLYLHILLVFTRCIYDCEWFKPVHSFQGAGRRLVRTLETVLGTNCLHNIGEIAE